MMRSGHKPAAAYLAAFAALVAFTACAGEPAQNHALAPDAPSDRDASVDAPDAAAADDPWAVGPPLGARRRASADLEVRVRAPHATRIELCLFAVSFGANERLRLPMDRQGDVFSLRVDAARLHDAGLEGTLFYGLRAFGPNWTYAEAFTPGSLAGFVRDVDADGNRMNPNKLLLDPYALEVSHDPIHLGNGDGSVFRSGDKTRQVDSGPFAPKGVVLPLPRERSIGQPVRPLRDDVVYEVHVRGFTKTDEGMPAEERGTYAGAARRAKYLRELGVSVIELLPLHETPNDQNDRTPESQGDNYWGYSTLSFFAPDRRYAADRSPGGPTRELRAMVEAFHAEGIKVWVDVVFNHTAEGGAAGDSATIYSFRGLDNATYYELDDDAARYVSSNGVGPNFNTASPVTADLVVDSLRYWRQVLGVDGFRFDLASIVANRCTRGCYAFDRGGLVTRIAKELPARPTDGGDGADLVAEPWGLAAGSYQVGGFPAGWSEWNDRYRDTVRKSLNRLEVEPVPPREIARRISGSPDIYADRGRPPAASINFVVAHDGMTLADLFSYDAKKNDQPWPFGPSSGGTDADRAFSHGGDPKRQRGATRTAFALAALSAGVPMFTGGDERLRTQHGNNNAYNLDGTGTWLDWQPSPTSDAFLLFAKRVLGFRNAHRALRPAGHWHEQVTWLTDLGKVADAAYLDAPDRHYLGYMLDGASLDDDARALFVAYNAWSSAITVTPPPPPAGTSWRLAGDTSVAAEAWGSWRAPGDEEPVTGATYALGLRALAVFVAR